MLASSTTDLNLVQTWIDGDPDHEVHVNFPLNRAEGTDASAVVYFEIPPGKRLASHTDSAEEILYIATGEGEAYVGDESGPVRAGDLAVIPAMVPHGVRNTGTETLRVVGFFAAADVISTFDHPVQPVGQAQMSQQRIPAAA